ncbi:acetyltransferase [Thioploca ingrica]|uniref:Acetyltransferase n=1 Tax=Thioploca ingrica TaxID=40754 RepID=A0A090AMZ5_9GAMM|nr:acetyltransferase [Thioploca ingrica]
MGKKIAMISPLAVVNTKQIGQGVIIHPFVVVQENVSIGNQVVIHPHVVIESGVIIGDGTEIFPGAYLGKEPKGAGVTARQPEFIRQLMIGQNCSIGPNVVIYYDVVVGNQCLIGDNASIREKVTIGDKCIIGRSVVINYNVKIGNRSKIMDLASITGNCQIGEDVFISMQVGTANDNAMGTLGYDETRIQGPKIKDGAMIGVGANLLPGVEIGDGAVVAAGAVVSKDVLPKTMVAGIPARFVKKLSES